MATGSMKVQSKAKTLPHPYHVFAMLGESFVFDTSACRFYKTDMPTARFLELCQDKSIENAKQVLVDEGVYSKEAIDHIAKEISFLSKNGLFDIIDFSVKKKDVEREIDRIYSSPICNIELAISEICNLSCKYCYCEQCRELPGAGLMSKATAEQAVDWLFEVSGNLKALGILFFGGEPLLNKPVVRSVVDYSKHLAMQHGKVVTYSMTTNGTLLDDEFMDFIQEHQITVMVSLDGKKETHDAQCPTKNGRGSYDMAAAGAKRLLSKRQTDARCTMAHPMPNLKELIDFFERFGFRAARIGGAINIPQLQSPVDFTEEDYAEFARQNEAYIPEFLERTSSKKQIIYNPFHQLLENIKKCTTPNSIKCGAGHSSLFVATDGTLYPCHRFGGMAKWKIGHISSGVDHARYKKFWLDYRNSLKHSCELCWAWSVCQGPCPWEVVKPDGTFEKAVRHCDFRKSYVEQAAYIYAWQQQPLPTKSKADKSDSITKTNVPAAKTVNY